MLGNNLKMALRYLRLHKGYTAINVLGLSIGIACCLLIMLFVRSEFSFDRFHNNADRIYRVWLVENYEGEKFENSVTPLPLAQALQSHIPEVESTSRVFATNANIRFASNTFNERIHLVDSSFLQLFDFDIVHGSASALNNKSAVVITEVFAEKYFGKAEALGKMLEIGLGSDTLLVQVGGVCKAPPLESSIQFEILLPFSNDTYLFNEKQRTSAWSQVYTETYVLLKPNANALSAEAKLPQMVKAVTGDKYKPGSYNLFLQPLTEIHLDRNVPEGIEPVSDPRYSYFLGTIGILVLVIACINFVTLAIGRSVTRSLEVGVRKVLGAQRRQLIQQYWGEAMFLTLIALFAGILLAILFLKPFNQVANRELFLGFDLFTIGFCLLLVAVVGLISGLYPAVVLSAFAPIEVLKGKLSSRATMGLFRKGLIVGQFVASIVMIIATLAVGRQLNYLQTKDLGYSKERIIIIPTNRPRSQGYPLAERLKQEVSKLPGVMSSSTSIYTLAEPGWVSLGYTDDKKVFRNFRMNAIDEDFIPTMKLQLLKGRNFAKENSADVNNSMIVNEALVREYGWEDPIGKKLPGEYQFSVIGVVKDFHIESLHTPVAPLALVLRPDSMFSWSSDVNIPASFTPRLSVRLNSGNLQQQVASLKQAWTNVAGDREFEFRFLDDALSAAYEQEQRLGKMVKYASAVSIFIACMGLFGLATLIVVRRTREIGIRKVLGADVYQIVLLISRDFILLVVIASVLAFPIAWWMLNYWMQDFAYRTNLPAWIFVAAALLSLAIALLTVGLQAIRAAITNPVKALRSE